MEKAIIVVPTYWGREREERLKGDIVFDHPIPLDEEGTLGRCLESLNIIKGKFLVLLIVAPVHPEISDKVEERVKEIVSKVERHYPLLTFFPSYLKELYRYFESRIKEIREIVNTKGYSQVRNLCILFPLILGAECAILVDDDEVVEEEDFLETALEFQGKDFEGKRIGAKAGYYLQPHGSPFFKGRNLWWKRPFWDNRKKMNQAFSIIEQEPRIKDTPFAFGGNMVIFRELLESGVSFDPWIGRGEDLDYLVSAKMAGFAFVLDNRLKIKHLQPASRQEAWRKMKEDIKRFLYMRIKLKKAKFPINDLNPYPGYFLTPYLRLKAALTSILLGMDYLLKFKVKGLFPSLGNILLSFRGFGRDVEKYSFFQRRWKGILPHFKEAASLRAYLEKRIAR